MEKESQSWKNWRKHCFWVQVNHFLPKLKAKVRVEKIWFFFIFSSKSWFFRLWRANFFQLYSKPINFPTLTQKLCFFLQNEKKINHLLFYSPWTQGNLLIASQVCRWSHKRLPPPFYLYLSFICDVITMAVREQLRMWAGGRIYLYFSQAQDLDSVPDSLEQNCICGNFSHHCNCVCALEQNCICGNFSYHCNSGSQEGNISPFLNFLNNCSFCNKRESSPIYSIYLPTTTPTPIRTWFFHNMKGERAWSFVLRNHIG